ncbi:MAG: Carnitine transport permease protein OpuCB [Anaerolineae bacterium]|nr:Carnitine transport permease protein OpuCB [Anaerolineae bacterium]
MDYIFNHPALVFELLLQHLFVVGVALLCAIAIALPLSVLILQSARLTAFVLGIFTLLYTIPSIALIILLIPFTGLNEWSVIIALILYVQVILVRNNVAALNGIDPAVLEAARGMGMNGWQRWRRVQLPLGLPVMLAGVRIAAVVAIGIAAIGAKFNAGGLGRLLFDGIAQTGRYDKIWAGAIAVAALAFAVNFAFMALEKYTDPARKIQMHVASK